MNKNTPTITRPPLETLACVHHRCELYGQKGQNNLTVRKTYGKDEIRYLRCQACGTEFSERKHTALWNTKITEAKAVAVGEHLAEGCSLKGTARLVKVDPSTVRRLNQRLGDHGEAFHHERVQVVEVEILEADERHGYAGEKGQPAWEAELMDPKSKFILSHVQGQRDEELIRRLLSDGASRLANRHALVLMTDGDASYASLFPELFGQPYRPRRQGNRGRWPQLRFRIPRTLAHAQIVKRREGGRVVQVDVRYTHGSAKRVHQALECLGYLTPNTSAIERRNGTARRMSAHQVRKSLLSPAAPTPNWPSVGGASPSITGVGLTGPYGIPWCHRWAKKVPTPDACDGLGAGRSSLSRSGDSPHSGVSSGRLEIISCHHPPMRVGEEKKLERPPVGTSHQSVRTGVEVQDRLAVKT